MNYNTSNAHNNTITQIEFDELKKNIDDSFLIFNGIIVSKAGCIHPKNVTNILLKNILDLFFCSISYWFVGYGLAYGNGNPYYGIDYYAGVGMPDDKMAFWFFQFIFAATAATLISGAVAERCNFIAYIFYSTIISGVTYPIVAHWVWAPNGWLLNLGYSDFSGAGAVHLLAGTCSFIAALFLGPRTGRFDSSNPRDFNGHSMPLVATGTLLIITGFLAFNGGSLGHITSPGDGAIVAKSISNTITGGSGAAVCILMLSKAGFLGKSRWPFLISINGILIGMVSVCGAVNDYSYISSFTIGVIGCLVYVVLQYLVPLLKVDDPLEATAVHFGGGLWGVIAVPFFTKGGISNNSSLLKSNLIGAGAIVLWSVINSVILFGFLKVFDLLRVSEEKEHIGLDISLHKEQAYPVSITNINIENDNTNTFSKNGHDNLALNFP
ncbi:putative ammonium transporter 1 isoform X2 [Daktulosphaira vitifoliae]|uniref:putative ammonium transporter 1 isoform X2 n=1 Tax=Daktulosphaira vitifoliae TaxID=58002 RepID=UPI0021AA2E07|nr:putative ammonium transporter 1 isoform X2 [Daktulosphaira vitifoliae]